MERDYSTISPSAKSLLLMKGLTDIPYAHEAASLMEAPKPYKPDVNNKDLRYWAMVMHMEARYKSINKLMQSIDPQQVLELSSGFSFRGLAEATTRAGVHYIDTDLPNIIDLKKTFIPSFKNADILPGSKLEILPLNAIDEDAFLAMADRFDDGPITIVNEGLLVYLDEAEKEKLFNNIKKVLQKHGGYWITADVYIKSLMGRVGASGGDQLDEFLKQHHIEEKKFNSFGAAAAFFNRMGFVVDACEDVEITSLSTFKYFEKNFPEQAKLFQMGGKIHETWRVRVA